MRKLRSLGVIAVVLSASFYAYAAGMHSWRYHGSVCQKSLSSSQVKYSQYGIENTATSGSTTEVTCALPLSGTVTTTETLANMAQITYYDRGAFSRVSCTLQAVDSAGNVIYSEAHTSPSGGIGTGLQQFLFNPSGVNIQGAWLMAVCNLPPNNSGWPSHIVQTLLFSQF
jgi:hypothetical protein